MLSEDLLVDSLKEYGLILFWTGELIMSLKGIPRIFPIRSITSCLDLLTIDVPRTYE